MPPPKSPWSPGLRVWARAAIHKITSGDLSLARRLRQGERIASETTGKRRRRLQAAAAPEAAPVPPPAICANCGKYVVEKARKILDGESGSKDAYGAALEAARTTDADGSVVLASETESGEEEVGSAGGDSDIGAKSEEPGSEESSGSVEEPADAGESTGEGSASSGTEAEPGEKAVGVDTEPVSQRNVLSSGLRERASSSSVLVEGTGVLLLAAGLFVARRTLGK